MTLSFDPDDPHFQLAVIKALWYIDPLLGGVSRRIIMNSLDLLETPEKLHRLSLTLSVLKKRGLVCHPTKVSWTTTPKAPHPMRLENVPDGSMIVLQEPGGIPGLTNTLLVANLVPGWAPGTDYIRIDRDDNSWTKTLADAGRVFIVVGRRNSYEVNVVGKTPGIYRLSVHDVMRYFVKVKE